MLEINTKSRFIIFIRIFLSVSLILLGAFGAAISNHWTYLVFSPSWFNIGVCFLLFVFYFVSLDTEIVKKFLQWGNWRYQFKTIFLCIPLLFFSYGFSCTLLYLNEKIFSGRVENAIIVANVDRCTLGKSWSEFWKIELIERNQEIYQCSHVFKHYFLEKNHKLPHHFQVVSHENVLGQSISIHDRDSIIFLGE